MSWALAILLGAAPVELAASDTCHDVEIAEARRVLFVELRRPQEQAGGDFLTRVTVECEGQHVTLTVYDPVTRKTVVRTVDLSHVHQKARGRTIGLAAAELVAISWSELVTHPEPVVEPAAPPPPPEVRDDAAAIARAHSPVLRQRSRLLVEGTLAFAPQAPVLWGGGLRWAWERFEIFGLEALGRLEHGTASFPEGTVDVSRASLGLFAHARASPDPFTLRVIAGLRGGAVSLSGNPKAGVRAGSGFGPWLSLSLGAAASVRLATFSLELGAELGFPLAGVVGTVFGADAVRLDGFWGGLHLGVGLEQ